MIEVFKTDVNDCDSARRLIDRIHATFSYCEANFDLDDCDRVLRVKGVRSAGEVFEIISLARDMGFYAQVLPDDYPSSNNILVAGPEESVTAEI